MRNKIVLFMLLALTVVGVQAQAQNTPPPYILTADSLTSGNYKDIFKSFFQLTFNRLTSSNKDLGFSSNPFAIMARNNPKLLVDTSYVRYKALRNLNFSFYARLDSSFKFNGFSSGITYAIINRRDETVSHYFLAQASAANKEFDQMFTGLQQYVSTLPDLATKNKINDQINAFFEDGTTTFKDLDPGLQAEIKKQAAAVHAGYLLSLLDNDARTNFGKLIKANYDSVKTDFQNRLLWTAGVSDTTYNDHFMFSNVVLTSNLVKGISKPNKVCGLELNIKAAYQFVDDSLTAGRNLKRNVFTFEPGLNLIIKTKRNQYPWAEFKLSGEYVHINRPYGYEKKDCLFVNSTLRIRVFDDIWVPLEIRYDPTSGNVFGFLNIRANFTGVKKLVKGS